MRENENMVSCTVNKCMKHVRNAVLWLPSYSLLMKHTVASHGTKVSGQLRRYIKPYCNWTLVCQKKVSRAGTSIYIPQYMWDVITCPCPWCHDVSFWHYSSPVIRQEHIQPLVCSWWLRLHCLGNIWTYHSQACPRIGLRVFLLAEFVVEIFTHVLQNYWAHFTNMV